MNRLYEILSAKAAMPADWIKHTTPIEDLEIDSLDFIEMVFEIEEAFDVKIPAEWDHEFATVGDLSDALERLQNSETPVSE